MENNNTTLSFDRFWHEWEWFKTGKHAINNYSAFYNLFAVSGSAYGLLVQAAMTEADKYVSNINSLP